MALTANQLAAMRRELGATEPTDGELEVIFARLGNAGAVVLEVLETRLATFASEPAQFSLSGVYSQDTGTNITTLREQLDRLRGSLDSSALNPLFTGGLTVIRPRYTAR